jgi:hypothetical protein
MAIDRTVLDGTGLGFTASFKTKAELEADSAALASLKAAAESTAPAVVDVAPSTPADLSVTASTTAGNVTIPTGTQSVEVFNHSDVVIFVSFTNSDPDLGEAGVIPLPAYSNGVAGYYSFPPGMFGTLYHKAASGSGKRLVILRGD